MKHVLPRLLRPGGTPRSAGDAQYVYVTCEYASSLPARKRSSSTWCTRASGGARGASGARDEMRMASRRPACSPGASTRGRAAGAGGSGGAAASASAKGVPRPLRQ